MPGTVRNADQDIVASDSIGERDGAAERNMPLIVTLFGDVVLLDGIVSLPLLLHETIRAVGAVRRCSGT